MPPKNEDRPRTFGVAVACVVGSVLLAGIWTALGIGPSCRSTGSTPELELLAALVALVAIGFAVYAALRGQSLVLLLAQFLFLLLAGELLAFVTFLGVAGNHGCFI